ncbi:MAG: hypothetical protein VX764_08835 [Planctomycetota bacterium]|nr:hypothetical protein [Planctomycetota bacterium]
MSNLIKMPISKAVALTAMITAVCSIWLIGDSGSGISVIAQGVEAQGSTSGNQSDEIAALQARLTRIEGQLVEFTSTRPDSDVQILIENLRLDLENLRASRANSPDLPLPLSHYQQVAPAETDSNPETVTQEFEFRTKVKPESIIIVQGSRPGFVVSVELKDENQNWIEMYEGPDLSSKPASETWIEGLESTSTNTIRVTVTGKGGIEAVGVTVKDVIHWSMVSN